MDSFAEIVQRFSPAAWYDRGITLRDSTEFSQASHRPYSRSPSSFIRRGVIGVAAAGAVAASTFLGAPDVSASSNVHAASQLFGMNAQSEVPPGYWPKMISRLRALPKVDEQRYVEMDSLI